MIQPTKQTSTTRVATCVLQQINTPHSEEQPTRCSASERANPSNNMTCHVFALGGWLSCDVACASIMAVWCGAVRCGEAPGQTAGLTDPQQLHVLDRASRHAGEAEAKASAVDVRRMLGALQGFRQVCDLLLVIPGVGWLVRFGSVRFACVCVRHHRRCHGEQVAAHALCVCARAARVRLARERQARHQKTNTNQPTNPPTSLFNQSTHLLAWMRPRAKKAPPSVYV